MIYGSCVARDIVRIVPGRFGIVHYAARQSWVSAASKPLKRPQNVELGVSSARSTFADFLPNIRSTIRNYVARQGWVSAASKPLKRPQNVELGAFSTRSIIGDFQSNIPAIIRKFGDKADVILIDIASDRHGVYPVGDSFISNTGELRRSKLLRTLDHGPLVEFGTPEHQRLFKLAVAKVKRTLVSAGVFDRVLVLNVQFAGKSNDGTPMPLARGMTSTEVNSKYEYYYQVFEHYGFRVVPEPPAELQIANSDHKWGLQQDHFIDPLYHWWADRIDEFAVENKN